MNLVMEDVSTVSKEPVSEAQAPQKRLRSQADADILATWRAELDDCHQKMEEFHRYETADIFRLLASFSARASYIRGQVMRSEKRALTAFRTQELDPFISTLDYQFKVWSRYQTTLQIEWEMNNNGRI